MDSNENLLKYVIKQIDTTPNFVNTFLNRDDKHINMYSTLKNYVDDFLNGLNENRFIVMSGFRGVGKTTLLLQIYDYLTGSKNIGENRVLYLSADEITELFNSNIGDVVNVYIEEVLKNSIDEKIFILIDDSQCDENYYQVGKELYDNYENVFTLFASSDFSDLNGEANREIIYPMNFTEYLSLKYDLDTIDISEELFNMILTGDFRSVSKKEQELTSTFKKYLTDEWNYYLCFGNFPSSVNLNKFNAYEKIYEDIIKKVIKTDTIRYQSFSNESKNRIINTLSYLATKEPDRISIYNLAKEFEISRTLARNMLHLLEKTNVIFYINPYDFETNSKKSFKYYFQSPSLNASVNYVLGNHDVENVDYMNILSETLVASTFLRLKDTVFKFREISYPIEKNTTTFILTTDNGDNIPVEVGICPNTQRYVNNSIKLYDAEYAIVISHEISKVKKEDNVIYLPLKTFSFI